MAVNSTDGLSAQASGDFYVKGSLNFAGKFLVGIQGNVSDSNGILHVTPGTMNLQPGNSLAVTVNGQLSGVSWDIIYTGGNDFAQFTNGANPAPGLTGHTNQPQKGDYQLTSP